MRAEGWSPLDVAALAVHLPEGSAVVKARSGDSWWVTPQIEFLREVEFNLSVIAWQRTLDGSKGRNAPKRIPLPTDEPTTDVIAGDGEGFDSFAEADAWRVAYFDRKRREKVTA